MKKKINWSTLQKKGILAVALAGLAVLSPDTAGLAAVNVEQKEEKASDPARLEDGTYYIEVKLEGGSGKASVTSPADLLIKEGEIQIRIEWSSSNYDYMKVEGKTYYPISGEKNSVFEIPVSSLDKTLKITADTTAMSTPHEIEYTLCFFPDSICIAEEGDEKKSSVSETEDLGEAKGAEGKKTEKEEGNCGEEKKLPAESVSSQLVYDHSMELNYAEEFSVDYYQEGFLLLTIAGENQYLLIPEGKEAPDDLEEGIRVVYRPLKNIYLAASAAMDMFVSLDALDCVHFSALKEESWYIPEAKEAMESGKIIYAGKYSAPDYEQILALGCDLAIENTMIYHTPEVKEQLEKFNIPVIVDYSSYETNPLGRTEWVKLYGVLTGKEEKASEAFEKQRKAFEAVSGDEKTNQTVAFFYITSQGEINVRRPTDYLPEMIELAGGAYFLENTGEESHSSTMTMQMEEFYVQAKEADYIIYNSTVDGEISSIRELTEKNSLLSKLKAVKEGKVYGTTQNLYQSSMELGTILTDLHGMLTGNTENLTYLYKLE